MQLIFHTFPPTGFETHGVDMEAVKQTAEVSKNRAAPLVVINESEIASQLEVIEIEIVRKSGERARFWISANTLNYRPTVIVATNGKNKTKRKNMAGSYKV
jgi:hypothetical protein